MQRILFTLQYRGTRYAGWQRQTNAVAIQQIFEEALGTMCGAAIRSEAAGRTDAGVHAEAQHVQADLPIEARERGLVLGLNNLLPEDIRVTAATIVPGTFHCRFDKSAKTYVYRIWNDSVSDAFLFETHALVPSPLDLERMREAARLLVGHHDFRSFTVLNPEVSSTWRTITSIDLARDSRRIEIRVTADGFLRYMVRRIAGILIEIGRGKLPAGAAADALEPSFGIARWTAPPEGLTLEKITYSEPPGAPKLLC
jgi:tRNA pseudouridine38-40 synthase